MKIAAFQFRGSGDIGENFLALKRGIEKAAAQNVRMLITQECALCGYPPVETDIHQIDFQQAEDAARQLARLAARCGMAVALGTILAGPDGPTNSLLLLSPDGEMRPLYHKRALWGWDRQNFTPGREEGVCAVDGVSLGFRICYEVRFPEYFRELFRAGVEMACVSFCDVEKEPNPARYELIKAHLVTRAVENALYVLSANSISGCQTAPTCFIDPDGRLLETAPPGEEYLLAFECEKAGSNFGRDGRIQHSQELLGI